MTDTTDKRRTIPPSRLAAALFALALLFPAPAFAAAEPSFVRTADYYLLSGTALESPDTIKRLAAFDVIIIPAEAQAYNRPFFAAVRRLNPRIRILAYVPAVSWNDAYWNDPLHAALKAGIRDAWWLTDASGRRVSLWPGTTALNMDSGWVPYLSDFAAHTILGSGLWDGVFYDEVQDSIDWVGSADVDRDGRNDAPAQANALWTDGFKTLLRDTRAEAGPGPIIVTNGSSNPAFAPYVNGRMYESFPTSGLAAWTSALRDYLREQSLLPAPATLIVNANTGNTGARDDYRAMRFGLGSALLGDGYFSFDFGTQSHAQLWRYDEENAYLGEPKGAPANIASHVWTRPFSDGEVVVNAGSAPQTVTLDGEYERLHGAQDPSVNNGSISSRVTVGAQDGIVLLRPVDQLDNAAFPNGAFARIFDNRARVKRTGFFAYDESAQGGTRVEILEASASPPAKGGLPADVTSAGGGVCASAGGGVRVVADQTDVTVAAADGSVRAHFAPYGASFRGGVSVAVADVDGDGQPDIVTAPMAGLAPQVRVFGLDGTPKASFAAFPGRAHGAFVAAGDVDGDGRAEIVVGAGAGEEPLVRVFTGSGQPVGRPFYGFPAAFRGGVHVAAGDVDGDGRAEIVVGAGAGGGPQVRIFKADGTLEGQFFAGSQNSRSGTDVAAADVDGDGRAEIIALSTNVFTLESSAVSH